MAAGTGPRNSGELYRGLAGAERRGLLLHWRRTAALASPAETEDIPLPVKCAMLI